jgi:hypothetical protein
MDKFVLPEKWCIRQNRREINDWLNVHKQTKHTYTDLKGVKFIRYPAYSTNHLYSTVQPGYTQITYEQFEKYILNKQPEVIVEKEDLSYLETLLNNIIKDVR